MKRWLFNLAAGGSLFLSGLAATFWIRSYWRGDQWSGQLESPVSSTPEPRRSQDVRTWVLVSGAGGAGFGTMRRTGPASDVPQPDGWIVTPQPQYPQSRPLLREVREVHIVRALRALMDAHSSKKRLLIGDWGADERARENLKEAEVEYALSVSRVTELESVVSHTQNSASPFALVHEKFTVVPGRAWVVIFPYWAMVLVLGLFGCIFALPQVRRWKRTRQRLGLCVRCGYDLHASPERCPECGTSPAQMGFDSEAGRIS